MKQQESEAEVVAMMLCRIADGHDLGAHSVPAYAEDARLSILCLQARVSELERAIADILQATLRAYRTPQPCKPQDPEPPRDDAAST